MGFESAPEENSMGKLGTGAVFAPVRSGSLETDERHSGDQGAPWTSAQLRSLRAAQTETVPSKDDFWNAVAGKVEGKDAQQCQKKWFETFVTPRRGGRRKAGGRDSSEQMKRKNTPLVERTPNYCQQPQGLGSPPPMNDARSSADDLFHATPLRGRSRFADQPRGSGAALVEKGTPKTPRGPVAPCGNVNIVSTRPKYENVNINSPQKRGVSKAYVQTMSKKTRKIIGTTKWSSTRVESTKFGAAGRRIHEVANAQGHALKVSVSRSGAVRMTSADDGCEGDEIGLSRESDVSDDD